MTKSEKHSVQEKLKAAVERFVHQINTVYHAQLNPESTVTLASAAPWQLLPVQLKTEFIDKAVNGDNASAEKSSWLPAVQCTDSRHSMQRSISYRGKQDIAWAVDKVDWEAGLELGTLPQQVVWDENNIAEQSHPDTGKTVAMQCLGYLPVGQVSLSIEASHITVDVCCIRDDAEQYTLVPREAVAYADQVLLDWSTKLAQATAEFKQTDDTAPISGVLEGTALFKVMFDALGKRSPLLEHRQIQYKTEKQVMHTMGLCADALREVIFSKLSATQVLKTAFHFSALFAALFMALSWAVPNLLQLVTYFVQYKFMAMEQFVVVMSLSLLSLVGLYQLHDVKQRLGAVKYQVLLSNVLWFIWCDFLVITTCKMLGIGGFISTYLLLTANLIPVMSAVCFAFIKRRVTQRYIAPFKGKL
uniref:hypothetical protein n=1 Tax=Thaumasiovibrio occultus TaxID=1891184 RepID=UPI000B35AD79|nr:hypothetical protein [Thaumasiovibrio occultus]